MYDVIVIGAGSAGATAAWVLARSGLKPLLLEAARTLPRNQASAGLGTDGLQERLAALGRPLPAGMVEERISRYTLVVPGSTPLEGTLHPYGFFLINRSRLDHFLVEEAVRAGTDLKLDWKATAVEAMEGGGWRIRGSKQSLTTRVLVLATGLRDTLADSLGFMPVTGGMGLVMEVDASHCRLDRHSLLIEMGALPHGFFWLCPLRGGFSVGLASTKVRIPGARRLLNAFMGRHGLTTAGILSSTKILLADSMRKGPSCLPGLVLIGDQIPVMDPLSGLGLDMSIRSGIHSARAICRGFDCGRFDFTPRMNRFRKEVERDFRVADRIASVLFSQPRRFLEALRAQPKRLEELALRVMGYRSYSSLDRPIFRTPFERFLRTLRRK